MALIAQTCEHPDGCDKPKDSKKYIKKDGSETLHYRKYCKPHCNRIARGDKKLGSVEIAPKAKNGEGHITENGYRAYYKPNHPLAESGGKVFEHRMVLYASIGAGKHPCNWCDRILQWGADLVVDHINFKKLDNRIENLVPSCLSCNTLRFNKLIRYILDNDIITEEVLRCL